MLVQKLWPFYCGTQIVIGQLNTTRTWYDSTATSYSTNYPDAERVI
jgi:hypothetical protein